MTDGDTITVLVDRQPVNVRLAEIDTPERCQPWANRAKQALSGKVFGQVVELQVVDTDRYGRTVAKVSPWEWRHGSATQQLLPKEQERTSALGFSCGAKRYCREMTSCEEARFYLERCGPPGSNGVAPPARGSLRAGRRRRRPAC